MSAAWTPSTIAEAGRGERVQVGARAQRDEERAREQDEEAHHHGENAGEAQRVSDRGEDQVGPAERG